ncbi:MAG: DUF4476 domain-containing protein [Chitinophagales bacterium]|nr:DUF4476 domain-containing protein [Chitinophagales bacterium]
MKFLVSTLFFFGTYSALIAQKAGLTFFSQEGELFYVILDGIRQNNAAAANVKVTDLDRPNYRVKIVFDNAELKDINKNLFVQDMDGKYFHTVYMIYKNKKGEMDLKMSSYNEAKDVAPTARESVVKYHDKEMPIETKTNTGTTSENVNLNMSGTNVNVKQSDESVSIKMDLGGLKDMMNMETGGQANTETTTTTVTTTTTTRSTNTNTKPKIDNPYEQPATSAPAPKGCILPMSSSDFEKGLASVKKQSFAESQMKTAKQMTKVNCLSVKQIRAIMDIFSFEDNKLEYAKFAYEFCTDKKNYFQLTEAFSFSSSADSLNEFLDSQH